MTIPSCRLAAYPLTSFLPGPLVITRASELLNASAFCGTADSSKRHQQGDVQGVQEAATADAVSDRVC